MLDFPSIAAIVALMNFSFCCLLFVVVCALSACTTVPVTLKYTPPLGSLMAGPRIISVEPFRDVREEGGNDREHYIGVIKTPVGTPLSYFETEIPVAQEVANGFSAGLDARSMLADDSQAYYTLSGEVQQLYGQQMVRPYATARVKVTLRDARSGELIFSDIFKAERAGFPTQQAGDAVLSLTSYVLSKVVDRALDDPGFRQALRE